MSGSEESSPVVWRHPTWPVQTDLRFASLHSASERQTRWPDCVKHQERAPNELYGAFLAGLRSTGTPVVATGTMKGQTRPHEVQQTSPT